MSIVVGLGCTLDHNVAEFQRVPVYALLVGNRQLGIGSGIALGILDVNELQRLVIRPIKELGAHPPEWVVNVRLGLTAGKVVAGRAITEADAAVLVEGVLDDVVVVEGVVNGPNYNIVDAPAHVVTWLLAQPSQSHFAAFDRDLGYAIAHVVSAHLCPQKNQRAILRWQIGGIDLVHPVIAERHVVVGMAAIVVGNK